MDTTNRLKSFYRENHGFPHDILAVKFLEHPFGVSYRVNFCPQFQIIHQFQVGVFYVTNGLIRSQSDRPGQFSRREDATTSVGCEARSSSRVVAARLAVS